MRISDWSSDVCSSDLQSAFLERSTITLARLSSGRGASRISSAPDVCFRERRCGLDFYLGMRRGLHMRAWEFSVACFLPRAPTPWRRDGSSEGLGADRSLATFFSTTGLSPSLFGHTPTEISR